MLNHHFHVMRDIRDEKKELAVTTNRISQPFKLFSDVINLRVDVLKGWNDSTKLAVKLEWSKDGNEFLEVGTFPIIDEHHGIMAIKFGDYVRYTLIVEGENQNIDVVLRF